MIIWLKSIINLYNVYNFFIAFSVECFIFALLFMFLICSACLKIKQILPVAYILGRGKRHFKKKNSEDHTVASRKKYKTL